MIKKIIHIYIFIIKKISKKLYYYNIVFINYLNGTINDLKCRKNINYDSDGYYITFYKNKPLNYKRIKKKYNYSDKSIPMLKYNNSYHYNAVSILQIALMEYGFYKSTRNIHHLNNALYIGDWVLNKQDAVNGILYNDFDYYHSPTNTIIKSPWGSAMVQGQIMSLMTRLYKINKNEKYLIAAQNAFKSLLIPIKEGGFLAEFNKYIFFEEYPTYPHSYTLNGFIFCLYGLYDMYQTFKSEEINETLKKGIDTLSYILPYYDDIDISCYDLSHMTSTHNKIKNIKYHIIHIILLKGLNEKYKNPVIDYYIKKWSKYIGIIEKEI